MKAGEILRGVAGTSASVLLCAVAALAQQKPHASAVPAPAARAKRPPAATAPAKKSEAAAAKAAAPSADTEKSGKNRDPFRTLIEEKKPAAAMVLPLHLPPGKKGLVVEQLQLQGIARALDGGWIAVVDNKTKRAYFLREKDELYNGVVSKVLPDRIVFDETITEATGKKTTREVVRKLSGDTEP